MRGLSSSLLTAHPPNGPGTSTGVLVVYRERGSGYGKHGIYLWSPEFMVGMGFGWVGG